MARERSNYEENTKYVSKKIVTNHESTNTTFRGKEILNCSITPSGVVKATIDKENGIINFERYDSTWCGEITLSLETMDEDDESQRYINDYNVQFKGFRFAKTNPEEYLYQDIDEWEESNELENSDVMILTKEEKEVVGGAKPKIIIGQTFYKTLNLTQDRMKSLVLRGRIVEIRYHDKKDEWNGQPKCEKNGNQLLMKNASGRNFVNHVITVITEVSTGAGYRYIISISGGGNLAIN